MSRISKDDVMDGAAIDEAELVEAMVDAYIARRRKGSAFDEIAATQAYWEYEPRITQGQAQALRDKGRSDSVDGWKGVLRRELARRQSMTRPLSSDGRVTADERRACHGQAATLATP